MSRYDHFAAGASPEFRGDYEPDPRKPGNIYVVRAHSTDPAYPEHGSMAGYVHYEHRPDPDDPGGYVKRVHMLEVNPGYRGRGVGKLLLNHVTRGYDRVDPGGFTTEGAGLWHAVMGEQVKATKRTDRPSRRNWRWA